MSEFKIGDIVVLTAGSMRMAVEGTENGKISTVWCNEGVIGRDKFDPILLKKWEYREEDKAKSPRVNISRSSEKKEIRGSMKKEKLKGKIGWDGRTREKKFFRKD